MTSWIQLVKITAVLYVFVCYAFLFSRSILACINVTYCFLLCGPPLEGCNALYSICLSVCPFASLSVCLMPTINEKTENYTMFKFCREVIHISSKWQSSFEVRRSKIKVTGEEMWKSFLVHIVMKDVLIHILTYKNLMTPMALCFTFCRVICSSKNVYFLR